MFLNCSQLPSNNLVKMLETNGANLSHFWAANNLVKFKNYEKCFWEPKYHALGHPSVKLQLMMSSQSGVMVI